MVDINRVNIRINLLIYDDFKNSQMYIFKRLKHKDTKGMKVRYFVYTLNPSSKTKSNIWDKGEHFINPTGRYKNSYVLCIY